MKFKLLILIVLLWGLPVAAADKIPLTIGAVSSPAIASDTFYQDMGAALSAAPSQPFDVRLLVRGEIGSDESYFYALRRGRIQIAAVGAQSAATAVPEFTVLNAPYLFDSWEEFDYVNTTVITPFGNDLLAEHGVVGLRLYGAAWHGVYANAPIHHPQDVAGKRFRALIDPASQLFIQALGADTFQVASPEVVTSLQTGLIEGGETNSFVYAMTGTSIDAPYYTQTHHTPSVITLLANKQWYESLSPKQRDLILNAHPNAADAAAAMRADEDRILNAAAADHVTLIEPTDAELSAWRAVGLSTHQDVIEAAGGRAQDLYDAIVAAKADFAAQQK
ncbi:MAG: TRAP transporter substrate-binding protein DctP [Rhodospirillaceae bacterium]